MTHSFIQMNDKEWLLTESIYSCEECPYCGWSSDMGTRWDPPEHTEFCNHPAREEMEHRIGYDGRLPYGEYPDSCIIRLLGNQYDDDGHPELNLIIRGCGDCPYCEVSVFEKYCEECGETEYVITELICNHYRVDQTDTPRDERLEITPILDRVPEECPMKWRKRNERNINFV